MRNKNEENRTLKEFETIELLNKKALLTNSDLQIF